MPLSIQFTKNVPHRLALTSAKIDPKRLIEGKAPAVDATLLSIMGSARSYSITGGIDARILLGGDVTDDEKYVTEEVEFLLSPVAIPDPDQIPNNGLPDPFTGEVVK